VIGSAAMALAGPGRPPYLGLMAQPLSTPQTIPAALHPARKAVPLAAMAGAGLAALAVLGASALWFHYGTAVFFEMIASGFQACF
jgi:hypothetical protein